MKEIMELLFSGHYGIYIPQSFAEKCNPENSWWFYSLEDAQILRDGPDHEHYWEVWEEVIGNAYWQENAEGPKYFLYQQDDLWMIHEDYSVDEHGQLHNIKTGEIQEP